MGFSGVNELRGIKPSTALRKNPCRDVLTYVSLSVSHFSGRTRDGIEMLDDGGLVPDPGGECRCPREE
jgi:hypothetical protein